MKILFYGAGVIGSIYAARLLNAGNDITLLARGARFDELKKQGILLQDALTDQETAFSVPIVERLNQDDFYDLIIVTVRLDQLDDVLPELKQNKKCPLVMLMLNHPDNIEGIKTELNEKQILLGFPGVGGTRQGNRIRYIQIKQQRTTIGATGAGIQQIKEIFESAGFSVDISNNMDAWLKIHAVFVSCMAASVLLEEGNSIQLGKNKEHVVRLVKSIREGFSACRSLNIPIVPNNLKMIFSILPVWISVAYWQKALQGIIGTLSIQPHANAAKAEMVLLAQKVLKLTRTSYHPTPILNDLLTTFIDQFSQH